MFASFWELCGNTMSSSGGLIFCKVNGRVKLESGIRFSDSVICQGLVKQELKSIKSKFAIMRVKVVQITDTTYQTQLKMQHRDISFYYLSSQSPAESV